MSASPPRPPPLWLLIVAAMLMPVTLHVVPPMVPTLAAAFVTDLGTAGLALSLYLVGVAVSQLVIGPVSDRFGRRPLMLVGLAVHVVASVACALAPAIAPFLAARVLQSFGGSSGMVVGRIMIRDCFDQDAAASRIGYVTTAMALSSVMAPVAGAWAEPLIGWRSAFLALAVAGAIALAAAWPCLAETNRRPLDRLDVGALANAMGRLLGDRTFMAMALCAAFNLANWFAFVAAMPVLMSTALDRPTTDYATYIVLVMVAYAGGNLVAGRFTQRFGGRRMIAVGMAIASASQGALFLFAWSGAADPLAYFLPVALCAIGAGFAQPSVQSIALGAIPGLAGAASGLLGFLSMAVAAVATKLVFVFGTDGMLPMATMLLVSILLSTLSLRLRPRA
jgi:DHA1 family bicyclomycin/chloramphenicol resistance-like MFS transporter